MAQFGKTVIEHGADEIVDVTVAQVGLVVFLAVGRGVSFLVQVTQHDGLLGILLDGDNHLVIVANGVIDALGWLLGHGDG